MGSRNSGAATGALLAVAAIALAAPTGGASLAVLGGAAASGAVAGGAVGGKNEREANKAKRTLAFETEKINQKISGQQRVEDQRGRDVALARSASIRAQRSGGSRSLLFGSELGVRQTLG